MILKIELEYKKEYTTQTIRELLNRLPVGTIVRSISGRDDSGSDFILSPDEIFTSQYPFLGPL